MQIDRVQIEEGFLDGLDVSFVSGLNVIVGERGTGKTSLIELVRFASACRGTRQTRLNGAWITRAPYWGAVK